MDPDAQEAAKRAELKERLEEIAGRKLDMTDEQLFSLLRPIASATYLTEKHDVQGGDDTWVTSERVISAQEVCTDSSLLDIGGLIKTGSNGRAVFRLNNFDRCLRHGFNDYSEPVNLLATPKGTSPVFMTISHELIFEPQFALNVDVEITASAWNPDGTAAANVPFYWRCRVPTSTVIFRSQ
jgi:hypothetical protein